jgi:hypothetical protein
LAVTSSRPKSAFAEIVPAISIAHAIQTPDNFEMLFMTPSVVGSTPDRVNVVSSDQAVSAFYANSSGWARPPFMKRPVTGA